MQESILKIKSYKFAIWIVKLYQLLIKEKKEFVLETSKNVDNFIIRFFDELKKSTNNKNQK